jgi:two-component system, LytTR family, sensor kinase
VDQRLILITLLVKLGVVTAVATTVVRSRIAKGLLFSEQRTLAQKIFLILFVGLPVAGGVIVRLTVKNFLAADIAFETAIVLGVVGGRFAGAVGGALVALPALIAGEFLGALVVVVAGFIGGLMRNLAEDREVIWSFSPFVGLSVYRWFRKNLRRPTVDWQTLFFLLVLVLEFARIQMGRAFPGQVFYLYVPAHWATMVAIYATTIFSISIFLKVWNNARIEIKLEEQEKLLLQARMDALQSQINPHFLFNTLNSIASLVRFDPDTARELVVKLASILRRLLRKHDTFVQLREELEFIDDYLDIEVVRFGRDKLRVEKDIDADTLDLAVPSMLLQPLVENSIKHGLAPKIDGGSITLRSRVAENSLLIDVEDDGVGFNASEVVEDPARKGIGMANVAERLRVLYGDSAGMSISPRDGVGTRIALRLPIINGADSELEPSTAARTLYEARSTTQR